MKQRESLNLFKASKMELVKEMSATESVTLNFDTSPLIKAFPVIKACIDSEMLLAIPEGEVEQQITDLLLQIELCIDNCEYACLEEFKQVLVLLKRIFTEQYTKDIECALDELQDNYDNWTTYKETKTEIMSNTGDEDLAEDIAAKAFMFG